MGKLLFAWLAAFVVAFAIGYAWHVVVMKDNYAEWTVDVKRDALDMIPVAVGGLLFTLVMAYMYPMGYKGGAPWMEGLRFGILIGLVASVANNIMFYGAWNIATDWVIVDSVWHIVQAGVAGVVIGVMYGKDPGS